MDMVNWFHSLVFQYLRLPRVDNSDIEVSNSYLFDIQNSTHNILPVTEQWYKLHGLGKQSVITYHHYLQTMTNFITESLSCSDILYLSWFNRELVYWVFYWMVFFRKDKERFLRRLWPGTCTYMLQCIKQYLGFIYIISCLGLLYDVMHLVNSRTTQSCSSSPRNLTIFFLAHTVFRFSFLESLRPESGMESDKFDSHFRSQLADKVSIFV